MSKKMVWEKTYAPGMEMTDIMGSPKDIAQLFRMEQERAARQYNIADPSTIQFEAEYYGYEGGVQMMVKWPRLETDTEYKQRLKREEMAEKKAAKKEEKERAEYERLKAKFEK